jgi:hypothetical protein
MNNADIYKELEDLLDQLQALAEQNSITVPVWNDMRKLMMISYERGYSKGEYNTHMKYAGTD